MIQEYSRCCLAGWRGRRVLGAPFLDSIIVLHNKRAQPATDAAGEIGSVATCLCDQLARLLLGEAEAVNVYPNRYFDAHWNSPPAAHLAQPNSSTTAAPAMNTPWNRTGRMAPVS